MEGAVQQRRVRKTPQGSNLTTYFIRACSRADIGLTIRLMEKSGNPISRIRTATGARTAMDIGLTQIEAGLGFRMRSSAGRPITTGVGRDGLTSVGFGFPARDGIRPGAPGAKATITSVGPHCPRKLPMTRERVLGNGSTTITTLVPRHICSSK